MSKNYENGRNLQDLIISGVNKLADNVASTLGPKGRNVILYKNGSQPIVTKDGVTVANFVELEDSFENVGAQIIKQAAAQTNSKAGDGTTTSTVLARSILNNTQKYLAAGASPVELKRGMDKAVDALLRDLKSMSHPLSSTEDIENVATISANGDQSIGKMIAMAVDQAGKDGSISIQEGKSMETTVDIAEGFRFDSGYFASAFITDERKSAVEYDDALLLVTNHKVELVEDILPILEFVSRESRPLIIVAEEVEGQALAALIMNTVRGTMKIAAVKAPRYGQERRKIMEDLSISCGATFVSRDSGLGLKDVKLENLGRCKKIEVLKNFTTLISGNCDWSLIDKRIESLKEEIKQTDNAEECLRIQERISRLASGVAVIRVGAPTEIEMVEKKHRIEDALEAVKSAREGGIVPGGGSTLVRCMNFDVEVDNEDQKLGVEIVRKSLSSPLRQMAVNAGESPDLIVDAVRASEQGSGWDFNSSAMVPMLDTGIIDPVKVTATALLNAVSVASTLITTGYAIIEE
jgi:chaperonin GroEL